MTQTGGRRPAATINSEATYIASAHADVVDAYDDVVRVFDLRYRPVFKLGLSWTIKKAGQILPWILAACVFKLLA